MTSIGDTARMKPLQKCHQSVKNRLNLQKSIRYSVTVSWFRVAMKIEGLFEVYLNTAHLMRVNITGD